MTYEAIVEFMKKNVKKSKTASIKNHVAVEFDIYGEGEGAFYVEISGGVPSVEPYEYYDRDAKVLISGDELEKLVKGEKTAAESMEDGILMLEGDSAAANALFAIFEKKAEKKTEKKPAAAKKASSTAKKTVSAIKEKIAKKADEIKTEEVKKAAPKKTAAKAEEKKTAAEAKPAKKSKK